MISIRPGQSPTTRESYKGLAQSLKIKSLLLERAQTVAQLNDSSADLDQSADKVVLFEQPLSNGSAAYTGVATLDGNKVTAFGLEEAANPDRQFRYEQLSNGSTAYAAPLPSTANGNLMHQVTVQTSNGALFIETASADKLDTTLARLKMEAGLGSPDIAPAPDNGLAPGYTYESCSTSGANVAAAASAEPAPAGGPGSGSPFGPYITADSQADIIPVPAEWDIPDNARQGTRFCTPTVSTSAAALVQRFPDLSLAQIRSILLRKLS